MKFIKSLFTKEGITTLFLRHGEKIALGFAGVIVLAVLAGTNWMPYPKKPSELLTLAKSSYDKVQSNLWPDKEKFDTLHADNTVARVNDKLSPLRRVNYDFPVELNLDITGGSEPLRDPKFEPVRDLTVTSGYCVLAQIKDLVTTPTADPTVSPTTVPDPFAGQNSDFVPSAGLTAPGASSEYGPPGMMGPGGPMGMGGPMGPGGPMGMNGEMNYDPYAGLEMNSLTASNMEPVALRYNAIRGIFPRRDQLRHIADALHITEFEAEPFLDFLNFNLQRRVLEPGQTNWEAAVWQDVDTKNAMDIIERAANFESDTVFSTITHPVFTMPLPARVLGFWGDRATHPGVKEFELSEEEKEIEAKLNQQVIQEYRNVLEAEAKKPGRGGFANYTNNLGAGIQQMGTDVFGESARAKKMLNELNKQFGGDKNMKEKIIEHLKARTSAAGNVLLFRYFDFDIQPDSQYQYRVQLVLVNPNYGQPVAEALSLEVVTGAERVTEWSAPSNPVYVEPDIDYFVNSTTPPKGFADASATLAMFEWNKQTGTHIKSNMPISIGQFVGGKVKTYVIRPEVPSYENEDAYFNSADLLVDVDYDIKVDREYHKDLAISERSLGYVGIVPKAVVVDETGKLQMMDSVSNLQRKTLVQTMVDQQHSYFESIKDALTKPATGMDEMSMEAMMLEEQMGVGMKRLSKKEQNLQRRLGTGEGP